MKVTDEHSLYKRAVKLQSYCWMMGLNYVLCYNLTTFQLATLATVPCLSPPLYYRILLLPLLNLERPLQESMAWHLSRFLCLGSSVGQTNQPSLSTVNVETSWG